MTAFMTLLDFARGHSLSPEDDGRARRVQLVIAALFASLVFALLWGVAVGCRNPMLAAANAYKLPMVVLVSSICAIPAGLLAWKLSGAQCRASDLLLGFTSGIFSGTLVLAVLAPIVALYYASSIWAGPMLAQGAIAVALLVGAAVFARGVLKRAGGARRTVILPMLVLEVIQIASVLQLIALASPILPERTQFDRGIDHVATPMERR